MKIYDISREVFTCEVYPGDPAPTMYKNKQIAQGDTYNLSSFSMCAHNGTHIDAPYHFFENGRRVSEIQLDKFVGKCFVANFDGEMCADDAEKLLSMVMSECGHAKRILIRGDAIITSDAARAFAKAEIYLIGVEAQSVGDPERPDEVHKILLNKEIVLLEGIRLRNVSVGEYLLCAAPLLIGDCEGSPCRAILIRE